MKQLLITFSIIFINLNMYSQSCNSGFYGDNNESYCYVRNDTLWLLKPTFWECWKEIAILKFANKRKLKNVKCEKVIKDKITIDTLNIYAQQFNYPTFRLFDWLGTEIKDSLLCYIKYGNNYKRIILGYDKNNFYYVGNNPFNFERASIEISGTIKDGFINFKIDKDSVILVKRGDALNYNIHLSPNLYLSHSDLVYKIEKNTITLNSKSKWKAYSFSIKLTKIMVDSISEVDYKVLNSYANFNLNKEKRYHWD